MTMKLSLGIDAGGTYTDLVLLDQESGRMVGRNKSPTTRPDPSGGIKIGLAGLDPQMLPYVRLVSVATTLATNAIVEGVGAEAGLILIGYDESPPVIPKDTKVLCLSGGHSVTGCEKAPLDLERLYRELPAFVCGLDAVAVAGFFSVRNPDHEKRVAQEIRERFDLPVVRGYQLSMKLDAVKRATTAWWNARLIPLISNLIHTCQRVLQEFGITAPLMVVRGDGTLMSADAALDRPVDTLLSGPAASILGAKYLAGVQNCVIIDMGGTTTDMAVLRDGRVVIDPVGARVGQWETHVEAAKVRTIGLGGDSFIQVNGQHQIIIGPRRVMPLCVEVARTPKLLDELRAVYRSISGEACRGINPTTFYIRPDGDLISEFELWTDSCQWRDSLNLADEERKGRLFRSALTPTDLRVAAGKFDLGDAEAARLGRAILARYLSISEKELEDAVEDRIARILCSEVVAFVGEDEGAALTSILPRWYHRPRDEDNGKVGLEINVRLTAPVVGVGAPAPACLPQALQHLDTQTLLPPGYDVSVAVGAVVGLVEMRFNGMIRPNSSGGWDLYTAAGKESFSDVNSALATGRQRLEELAIEDMRKNWVENPLFDFRFKEKIVTSASGDELHLQTDLFLVATGRPNVGNL
jgi:N-methylhydantoinase A/oxoprolinase/acetone carboxylase beta subunit